MTDHTGSVIWKAEYKAWGECKAEKTKSNFFENSEIISNNIRFQGQYFDQETGLHYNRYYSPCVGRFVSKDPVGLSGGYNIYAYAPNPIQWTDALGLAKTPTRTLQRNWKNYVGCKYTNSDIHHGFPEEYAEKFKELARINVNNLQYYYNLPKEKHTKTPGIHTNGSRTGQNWNKTWGGILNQVEAMNLSKAESKKMLEQTLRGLARNERISKHNATAVKGANLCCCS
nr:RHS repeat-associated core domain-containing protein [Acinetobacter sp. YH16042]